MDRASLILPTLGILLARGAVAGSRGVISADDCTGMCYLYHILSGAKHGEGGQGFL